MNYFLTVSLSHQTFTVKYYHEDDRTQQLTPLPGVSWPAPLAFYISDSGILLGEQARKKYQDKLPGAFFHIFKLLSDKSDYFTLNGEVRNARQALYVGIESLISDFRRNKLGGENQEDRDLTPIVFDFDPQVTESERQYAVNLFKDGEDGYCGGYRNIGIIDSNSILADEILRNNARNYVLFLTSDGYNLLMSLYTQSHESDKCIATFLEPECGADPRITSVVSALISQFMRDNAFFDAKTFMPQLNRIATKYMAEKYPRSETGEAELGDNTYSYFLNKSAVSENAADPADKIIPKIKSFLLNRAKVDIDDVVIALRGQETQADFFRGAIESKLCRPTIIDERLLADAQRALIKQVQSQQYILAEEMLQREEEEQELRERYASMTTSIRSVYIPDGKYTEARSMLNDFLEEARRKGISEFDDPIATMLERIEKEIVKQKFDSMFETVRNRVDGTLIPGRQFRQASQELEKLRTQLNEGGCHRYDSEIADLMDAVEIASKRPAVDYKKLFEEAKSLVLKDKLPNGKIQEALDLLDKFLHKLHDSGHYGLDADIDALAKYVKSKADSGDKPLDEQMASLKSRAVSMETDEALKEIHQLHAKCLDANRFDLMEALDNLAAYISHRHEQKPEVKTEKPEPRRERFDGPLPPPPGDGFEEAMELLERTVPQMIADGNKEEAYHLVNNLKLDLKGSGVTKYDDSIDRLLGLITGRKTDGESRPEKRTRPMTPLEEAISNRDFRRAKAIFNEQEDFDNAVKMTQLDKLNHKFEVAQRRVDDYKAEGNTAGIERCIGELSEYVSRLEEFDLQHDDVDALLKRFKN